MFISPTLSLLNKPVTFFRLLCGEQHRRNTHLGSPTQTNGVFVVGRSGGRGRLYAALRHPMRSPCRTRHPPTRNVPLCLDFTSSISRSNRITLLYPWYTHSLSLVLALSVASYVLLSPLFPFHCMSCRFPSSFLCLLRSDII